jgi:hypothetical protein
MRTKFNRELHSTLSSYRSERGFFGNKESRKSLFWHVMGDSTAYFIVFYIVGILIGKGLVLYIFVWPIIKAIFF